MSSTPSVSALHLALPGLCWPNNALRDLVFDLPLPALSALLGKATLTRYPVPDSSAWLGKLAGLDTANTPIAALRLLAAKEAAVGNWLCLDPVHLRIEKTQLVLNDPAELQLSNDEAEALAASLRPLLDELGSLHITAPGQWHLHCHQEYPIRTTPLLDAIGLNAEQLMPQADNVRIWRRVLNEAQMTLHNHPVNLARSERGLPVINSLWPWGEGNLPTTTSPRWTALHANPLQWQGLAQQMGYQYLSEPKRYQPTSGATLVISDALATTTRMGDAMRWRDSMQTLEANWFAPLLAAWKTGELREIGLHGSGSGQGLSCVIRASDRLRFWRKPAPLTHLGVESA